MSDPDDEFEFERWPPEDWTEEEVYGQDPSADLEYWSKAAYWTVEEATALSFGKEPRVVNWEFLSGMSDHPFATDYAKRRELALRAESMGQLAERTPPIKYIEWAKSVDIPFCAELEKLVLERSSPKTESVSQKQSAQTRERSTLLKLVLGMAFAYHGYDPELGRSQIPGEIAKDLENKGIKIDPDTVRKWLNEANEEHGHLPAAQSATAAGGKPSKGAKK